MWLLLLVQPVIILLLQKIKTKNQLNRYAEHNLQQWVISPDRKSLSQHLVQRRYFFLLAWILFSIAMAGPRNAQEIPGVVEQSRLDMMIVVDVSQSMQATDIKPGRLQRVQIELYELFRRTQQLRMGMVLYAGRSHLYFPLTADKKVSEFYLKSLDSMRLPTHGSNIVDALKMAADELSVNSNTGAIVVLTDGDFNLQGNKPVYLNQMLTDLKEKDIPLYILGVGSVEGEAIPLADGSWLLDNGNAIVSHMDEALLQRMADETGGRFSRVANDDSDWQLLYNNGLATLQTPIKTDKDNNDVIWYEFYPWLLMPGVFLFYMASLPFNVRLNGISKNIALLIGFSGIVTIISLSLTCPVYAADVEELKEAALSFQKRDYDQSRDLYKTINGYQARFGEGASRYRLGDYSGAIRQFSQAVLETNEFSQRAQALYNLANSYYQTGNYQSAVEVYNDVLRYQPGDTASIKNRDVSQILLQQIEERLQLEAAARAGSGPKSGTAAEAINLNESTRVSLGEDEENESARVLLPKIAGLSNDAFEKLVQKGIKYAKVAASGSVTGKQSDWQQQRMEARFLMQALEDNKSKHMQRLFEMEEGFAAPVEEPVNIPGVQPW